MADTNNASSMNGDRNNKTTEQASSRQLPLNRTTTRAGERTSTQKRTTPSPEKYDNDSAYLWWHKIVQYTKVTEEIDILTMVTSKETLPQYSELLETKLKDKFLWAIGQNALTWMTKTVRKKEHSSLPLYKLYTFFQLHYTPERIVQHI